MACRRHAGEGFGRLRVDRLAFNLVATIAAIVSGAGPNSVAGIAASMTHGGEDGVVRATAFLQQLLPAAHDVMAQAEVARHG